MDDTGSGRGRNTRGEPAGSRTDSDLDWIVLLATVMLFDLMALAGWFR